MYYGHDRHGNITDLTNTDGHITTQYTYTDYGTTTTPRRADTDDRHRRSGPARRWSVTSTYQPFQYAGEYTNPTGTQHLDARTYHPDTMRFTTEDTAQLHNRYAYADTNPITKIDPTGHNAEWDEIRDWVFLGVAVVGALISIGMAVFTGGASLGAFALARVMSLSAIVGDVVKVGITTGLLINWHVTRFMGSNTQEGLTYAEYALGGLGIAGAISGAVIGVLSSNWRRVTTLESLRTFDKAVDALADQPERLMAWRLRYHKDGTEKVYHHATKTENAAKAIAAGGFNSRYRGTGSGQLYGPGAYMAKTNDPHWGNHLLTVRPQPQTAIKLQGVQGETEFGRSLACAKSHVDQRLQTQSVLRRSSRRPVGDVRIPPRLRRGVPRRAQPPHCCQRGCKPRSNPGRAHPS